MNLKLNQRILKEFTILKIKYLKWRFQLSKSFEITHSYAENTGCTLEKTKNKLSRYFKKFYTVC